MCFFLHAITHHDNIIKLFIVFSQRHRKPGFGAYREFLESETNVRELQYGFISGYRDRKFPGIVSYRGLVRTFDTYGYARKRFPVVLVGDHAGNNFLLRKNLETAEEKE